MHDRSNRTAVDFKTEFKKKKEDYQIPFHLELIILLSNLKGR